MSANVGIDVSDLEAFEISMDLTEEGLKHRLGKTTINHNHLNKKLNTYILNLVIIIIIIIIITFIGMK